MMFFLKGLMGTGSRLVGNFPFVTGLIAALIAGFGYSVYQSNKQFNRGVQAANHQQTAKTLKAYKDEIQSVNKIRNSIERGGAFKRLRKLTCDECTAGQD